MPFVAQSEARDFRAMQQEKRGDEYLQGITEAVRSKAYVPEDFSLRDLFEHFVDDGYEALKSFAPQNGGGARAAGGSSVQLIESGINTGAFANLTGQIVYTSVMDAFEDPAFLAPQLARHVPTQFDGEKIPGIGRLGDQAQSIAPGDPYPRAGIGEEWIKTPSTQKRGNIVEVLKEDIFFDRTALVLERAREVSQGLAINKEKRVMDAVCGITDQYMKNDAAAIATYGDSSGAHDWDNLAASNGLVDWTHINAALLLFDGLTDPNTGEPIIVNPNQLLVPSALRLSAMRILHATEFRYVSTHTTISGNPVGNMPPLQIVTNQYVKARSSSATTWFIGDFKNAFWYMENWPITSVEAPPNSTAEFERDVAAQFKVSERGAIACREPRRVVKCTA